MPKRETALIALFHVRWRPLYCKQLRASLFCLSGWALVYFTPSPATACHKGTSVVDNTEVATLVSLWVSHKLSFPCKSLFCPFSVAPTERGETDTPPHQRFVYQYGQLWSGTKADWRCPHTPVPQNMSTTYSHNFPIHILSPLSCIAVF